MNNNPEALRLAHELDAYHNAPLRRAAIELRCQHYELRRLHAENERLRELLTEAKAEIHASKNYALLGRINAALQEDKT